MTALSLFIRSSSNTFLLLIVSPDQTILQLVDNHQDTHRLPSACSITPYRSEPLNRVLGEKRYVTPRRVERIKKNVANTP